ncbi:AsmA family protein [Bauldia sp.]|uniref:AsmA family protein n=1 Tax=Bauldia sp. TaxID=2575872 RepID=UPI003BAB63C5
MARRRGRRRGRRLLIGVLVAVVVVGGLIAAAPFIISTDLVKRQITDQIAYWTGRDFTFRGEPSISLYPYLTVRLREATLANPDGDDAEPFMDIETMTGKIELLPLLTGRIEFARFRLSNPRINLRTDPQGRGNWILDQGVIGTQISKGDKEGASDDIAPPSPLADIRLGRFLIRDGIVTYTDERTGRREELTKVDATFDWTRTSQAARGDGSFIWRGEPVTFDGNVGTPLDWLAGGSSPLRFAFSATPLTLAFDGTALQLDGTQLEGDIEMATPSVRRVAEWMGTDIGSGTIFAAGSVDGRINWLGPSVAITDATIELDGNAADGALSAMIGDGRSTLQGTLAFETLDLTSYAEALQAAAEVNGSWLAAPTVMPLDAMGAVDVRLSTNELTVGDASFGRTAATVVLDDGELSVSVEEMQVDDDGVLEARVTLTPQGNGIAATAQVEIANLVIGDLLEDTGDLVELDGIATVAMHLEGAGRTMREMIASLSGDGSVAIAEGTFGYADLTALPAAITGDADLAGSTAFTSAHGTFVFGDGAVATEDLEAEAAALDLTVTGRADLLTPTVEARGVLTLKQSDDEGGPRDVPFMIDGTWETLRLRPDLGPPVDRSELTVAPESNG